MLSDKHSVIAQAVAQMLRPLIRMLVRYGFSCPELLEVAKQIYVDVANKDFDIRGRKQSISRIATLTGLSRKDVKKIKVNAEEKINFTAAPINRANRVILGWLKDAEFIDAKNKPKIIPLRGIQKSFESLVRRYSGDIPMKAILDELNRIGAVRELDNERIKLVTEGYIPATDEEKINVMARCISDQLETIDFNLTHPPYEARFQRQVKYVDLAPEVVKEFQAYSRERSIELIMEFNLWLAEKKKTSSNATKTGNNEASGSAGFGLYYFEDKKK